MVLEHERSGAALTRQTGVLVLAGGTALMFGAMLAFGASGAALLFMAILALMMFGGIGLAMRTEADATWLPKWVILGFLAKLVGTYARYWMVAVLYGAGDSYRYYRVGLDLAGQWQTGIPPLTGRGAFGTQIVEWITGGLFTIFTPDLLGGFLMFSIIAFGGQLLLYAAFRRWAKPHQLKPYAFLIFLLPTYMFWPSSIGKDAIVVFALGGAAYFAARTLEAFEIRWIPGLVLFLGLLGLIRIHVAGLVVGGLVMAGLFAKLPPDIDPIAKVRRLVFVGVGVAAAAAVFTFFPDVFGVEITGEDSLDAFTSDVVRRTSESGTGGWRRHRPGRHSQGGRPGSVPSVCIRSQRVAALFRRPGDHRLSRPFHLEAARDAAQLEILAQQRLRGVLHFLRAGLLHSLQRGSQSGHHRPTTRPGPGLFPLHCDRARLGGAPEEATGDPSGQTTRPLPEGESRDERCARYRGDHGRTQIRECQRNQIEGRTPEHLDSDVRKDDQPDRHARLLQFVVGVVPIT